MVSTGTSNRFTIFNFLISQGNLRIPFEARRKFATDSVTGEGYHYYSFLTFGRLGSDPPGPNPIEPELEDFWKQKAAAALVVYGYHYEGLEKPPWRYRVLLGGKLYTRLDFGFKYQLFAEPWLGE